MCHSPVSNPGRTKFSRLDNSAGCCFFTFGSNKILGYFEKERKKNVLRGALNGINYGRPVVFLGTSSISHFCHALRSVRKNKKPWQRWVSHTSHDISTGTPLTVVTSPKTARWLSGLRPPALAPLPPPSPPFPRLSSSVKPTERCFPLIKFVYEGN